VIALLVTAALAPPVAAALAGPVAVALARPTLALAGPVAVALAQPMVLAAKPSLEQKIKEKQAIIESTRKKLEAKRGQLHQARFKVVTIKQQLDATNVSISRVEAQIADLQSQIEVTTRRLEIKKIQLAATRASLTRHRDALGTRLTGVYEYGPASYLDVLLSSTSFTDFVERWDLLRYIMHADAALISDINREAAREAKLVDELEATQAQLTTEQQDEQRKRDQLGELATERQTLLAAAQSQRNVVRQQVLELEGLTAAEEARLQELIREKQREDAEVVRQARLAAAAARRAAAMAAGIPLPPEHPMGTPGAFIWPVRGPVVSPFGMRVDPYTGRYQLHSGIDIAASYGVQIQASADGVVILASWYGGYGNTIIIDHGDGMSTLYAHCSVIYVSDRQRVAQGQVVGLVGATGWATGPHLHFEIRVNGVPVNPLTRL
jgi:murein DD-endopeptidase MepM/ murein hydrolase activator NlpD